VNHNGNSIHRKYNSSDGELFVGSVVETFEGSLNRLPTNIPLAKKVLPRPEFEEQEVWERLYSAEETQQAEGALERSWTEGEDGEQEFDRRVLASVVGKDVIDIGCGTSEFMLEMAVKACRVVGIDFSERALARSQRNLELRRLRNVEFKLARADNLPFSSATFDLAISRRGPAIDTIDSAKEVYRVLRKGGHLAVQEIGERDKQNWAEVFGGRGQMHGVPSASVEFRKRLEAVGFDDIRVDEFEANEFFATIQDVLIRMENSPIVPDFNRERDKHLLQKIEQQFKTQKGIVTNTHRVLLSATK
jgi:SAM-dependent methyltransferase